MSVSFIQIIKQVSLLIEQNKFSQAKDLLLPIIEPTQAYYRGYLLLSKCLFKLGEYQSAIIKSQDAEKLDPLQNEFQSIQANMQRRELGAAEQIAYEMLKQIPGHPRAIFTLAHTSQQQGFISKSVNHLHIGIEESPANVIFRKMLITNLESIGQYQHMLDEAKILVQLLPTSENRLHLIALLLKYARYEVVIEQCDFAQEQFYEQEGVMSDVELLRSHALRILGKTEGCISSLQSSLTYNKTNSRAWVALADLKTYKFNQDEISHLEKLTQSNSVKRQNQSLILFTLAKAREQQEGEHSAFQFYEQANALHSRFIDYRPENTQREFSFRRNTYNSKTLETQAAVNKNLTRPIFIVGLPRSGSTLLEQMLASHSSIQSTIEQPTLNAIERRANELCLQQFKKGLFGSIGLLSSESLSLLAQEYHHSTSVFLRSQSAFFIDKLPFNFRQIGLIHKILPDAVIIDVRRNPLDCGLSLFKQYFPSGVDFSFQLKHIAQFYNQYVDLMKHWEQVLPGRVLRIQYEELVMEPEKQLNTIFSNIGLELEASCLQFYKNKQMVHTASSEQVRQPLNSNGIGGWFEVKDRLNELEKNIEPLIFNEQREFMHVKNP